MATTCEMTRNDLRDIGNEEEIRRHSIELSVSSADGKVLLNTPDGMLQLPPSAAVSIATALLAEAQGITDRPESLWLFENGNIMAFSHDGRQISNLQLGYRKTCSWVEEHGESGITFYFAKWRDEQVVTDWSSWGDERVAGKHVRPEFHNNWLQV